MRRIIVTGGAGFIGSNFLRYCASRYPNDRFINLDALTYAGNLDNIKELKDYPNHRFIHGDICNAALLDRIFRDEQIDTVVHFAAESHVDRSISGPAAFIRTNIQGTFTLLEAAKKAWGEGSNSCRFLHVSTDEVYGSLLADEPAFTELTPHRPNSPYAASKASSDHLVRSYYHTYQLPVLTTNCSNNYGPYQFPEKLIPLTILNAIEGKSIPVYGDGLNIRDWLFVEDHCAGIDMVLQQGRVGEVYNIGGGNEKTNIDIVSSICDLIDKQLPEARSRRELITYVRDRRGHDRRYAIDASKIQRELGWTPRHDFNAGLNKTIAWYIDNVNYCERIKGGDYLEYYNQQYQCA
jgi:dTDP-glucose 4,6-dehydratase